MHGEIEEGAVIYDKTTGKSRGYGFITFKHMESTQSALRAPSKLIDVSFLIHLLAVSPFSLVEIHVILSFFKLFGWVLASLVGESSCLMLCST